MRPADIDLPASVDVIVIGAGPAGSVAALTLADAGRSVLLLERRELPRFHIGESQLAYTAEILRQLGLYDEAKANGYPVKTGAEFIFPDGDFRRTNFAEQGPGRFPTSFQVERSHFDNFLAQSAVKRGARLVENAVVHELIVDDDQRVSGVRYEAVGETRTVHAKWVLDCGGRASKAAQRFRTRNEITWLRNVAVFRHYDGLVERHNPGIEGDIQIGGHTDGWIWAIPIWPGTISIGAVMSRETLHAIGDPATALALHLARAPRIVQRLTGSIAREQVRVETDFCYYSDTVTGAGWMMAGDAGHFIDPIFSGGTFLAMASGREAGRTLDRILTDPGQEHDLQLSYASFYKTGYDSYTRLISAYYESGYRLGGYLRQRGFSVDGDPYFARILSGDFWSDTNMFTAYLRTQTQWDTFQPFELTTECPIYPELDRMERAGLAADTDLVPAAG
ncbi:MAG TPA: NAD(P)/FAD-dependent oxidoreductase [Streptosporangiaceae bacterium]|nr:NAD(P)/FAD-dependent oxidoreductase [Streptosporangiaceae bacterium]